MYLNNNNYSSKLKAKSNNFSIFGSASSLFWSTNLTWPIECCSNIFTCSGSVEQ